MTHGSPSSARGTSGCRWRCCSPSTTTSSRSTSTAARIAGLREGRSPINDAEIEDFLAHRELRLTFTDDPDEAYAGAEFVVIATPTDYDPVTNYFNTSTVEKVAADVAAANPSAVMVVKSTVPVGFTRGAGRSGSAPTT